MYIIKIHRARFDNRRYYTPHSWALPPGIKKIAVCNDFMSFLHEMDLVENLGVELYGR